MNKPIDTIMHKEMTRREFLTTLALGVGSVLGFSSIIHLLTGRSLHGHLRQSGFGSGTYGGGKD